MAAFNVTALPDFGYPETTKYIDPMEERWRAKSFTSGEFTDHTGVFSEESITASVQDYANANPYSDVLNIESALDEYWLSKQTQVKSRTGSRDSTSDNSAPSKREESGPIPRYRRFNH